MQEAGVIWEPHGAWRIRAGGNFTWQWPHLLSLLTPSPELMGSFLRRMVTPRRFFHNDDILWQVDANKNMLEFLKIVAF